MLNDVVRCHFTLILLHRLWGSTVVRVPAGKQSICKMFAAVQSKSMMTKVWFILVLFEILAAKPCYNSLNSLFKAQTCHPDIIEEQTKASNLRSAQSEANRGGERVQVYFPSRAPRTHPHPLTSEENGTSSRFPLFCDCFYSSGRHDCQTHNVRTFVLLVSPPSQFQFWPSRSSDQC